MEHPYEEQERKCCKAKNLDRRKAAAVLFGGLLAFYLLCVPSGAIRLSMAVHGYPISAVVCQVEDGFVSSFIDDEQDRPPFPIQILPYHVVQPPVERVTEGELENWAVYRVGPLCLSRYWGYC